MNKNVIKNNWEDFRNWIQQEEEWDKSYGEMQEFARQWDIKMHAQYDKEIALSRANAKIYPDRDIDVIEKNEHLKSVEWIKRNGSRKEDKRIKISVINSDTVSAVMDDPGERIAVLNFASYIYAGGGYTIGTMTQEDMLCYASDLYQVLSGRNDYYKHRLIGEEDTDQSPTWMEREDDKYRDLYHSDILYAPDILFFKDKKMQKADVITCAAPNVNGLIYSWGLYSPTKIQIIDRDALIAQIEKTLRSRIIHILGAVYDNEVDTLILGAWGCGAFGNDPYRVATAFKDCITEYGTYGRTENYIFAVPGFGGNSNYKVFCEVLENVIQNE